MIVANATFETRALFGAGDFAYSACSLSARSQTSDFTSLLLNGLPKQAVRVRLKLKRPATAQPALLSASADGMELAPELTVVSRRALESELTATIPVPAVWQDLFRVPAGDFSEFAPRAISITGRGEARHFFTSAYTPLTLVCRGDAARFLEGSPAFRCDAMRYLTGSVFAPCWSVSPFSFDADAVSLTVTAPWLRTHARSYKNLVGRVSCRREARCNLASACTLPKFGRALRL